MSDSNEKRSPDGKKRKPPSMARTLKELRRIQREVEKERDDECEERIALDEI